MCISFIKSDLSTRYHNLQQAVFLRKSQLDANNAFIQAIKTGNDLSESPVKIHEIKVFKHDLDSRQFLSVLNRCLTAF